MDLFVYGTLRDPDLMAAVAGPGPMNATDAALPDYHVRPLAGHVVPFIEAGHGPAKGILWRGITEQQRQRLDAYESAFGYVPAKAEVVADGDTHEAVIYMPPPDSVAGEGEWFLTDWRRQNGQASVFLAQELFSYDPPLTPAEISQAWHTAEMRAWARQRAVVARPTATLRHKAKRKDVQLKRVGPPLGDFFRLQACDVTHRQFDGTKSNSLRREVFLGVDAALVLPYDPKSDRVLLVEQMRMGPAMLGDPNPWVLEPVAGMVDARETPSQAALRETLEEAGLTDVTLQKINSFYPSPGSSTDYFHAYLGLCALSDRPAYAGGLDNESEDLRLHTLDFSKAMSLVASGEVTAGPLVMMLYWLALNRDAIRAAAA